MIAINFIPFPEMSAGNLTLRQLHSRDDRDILELRSNERVNRYIRRTPYRTIEEARAFIDKITEGIQQGSWIFWAIALKESGRLIGTICLWNIQPVNHRAEIGYELHPDYWGQGVIKNALPKVIKYAFRTMKLHSLEADLDPANLASARVLERTGFVKEGHFKESTFFNEKYTDRAVYSLINHTGPGN